MGEYAGRRIYSVAEIAGLLQQELEVAFPDIWVQGEVAKFTGAPSGHLYFTLRESGATLSAAMFQANARRMSFRPEPGMSVLVRGKLSYYPGGGTLQLIATHMEPSGVGAMMVALEQAKRRLVAEGLTDPARRRPIPPFPARVGVVTSAEGAALRDIISVLRRRKADFDLVLAHSPVQGAGSAASLAAALRRLQEVPGIEVILLARGGGSAEDLWAFNDETLAREVAASRLPVISAVGHEVDTVLTDLTADLRAATPSVAAELLTAEREAALAGALDGRRRLVSALRGRLRLSYERLDRASPIRLGAILARRRDLLAQRADHLNDLLLEALPGRLEAWSNRLARASDSISPAAFSRWITTRREALRTASAGLEAAWGRAFANRVDRAAALARLLDSLSPLAVIGRGYAAAFSRDGRLIAEPADAPPGSGLTVLLRGGGLLCRSEGEGGEGLPTTLDPGRTSGGPGGE